MSIPRGGSAAWFTHPVNPDAGELRDLRARLAARYPVVRFAEARRALDPKNILSNRIVNALLPRDDTATA